MKNVFNYLFKIILIFVMPSCNQLESDCLPYEGEIYDLGNPCSGIVIKVTNRDVNSSWIVEKNNTINDVIGVRFDEAHIPIDSSLINKKFYFDFRELSPEEVHPCPALWSSPSRIVYITNFSLGKCKDFDN